MSNNGYGYYYPPNGPGYPLNSQGWGEWGFQPHFNGSYIRPPPPPPPPFSTPPPLPEKDGDPSGTPNRMNQPPGQFYGNSNGPPGRMYPPRRFPNMSVPPPPPPPPPPSGAPMYQTGGGGGGGPGGYSRGWSHGPRKRPRGSPADGDDGVRAKVSKKKKKSLSQTVPSKKDWSVGEAERALATEREYNKRFKNHSLIIKFPDLELNREIVSRFHPAIDTVHFQQPSTPRFCFVTLKESEDADAVIKTLNKTRFGQGHLMAEYKKDREEDQNIGPEDVDPLTLYVGNLGQEVTKEDMVRAFPKGRRIDIGYAKKMKFTRYAFVSFKNVDDSIEAFKQTHNTQMFNKSLIVRFRRLHGTVGMPGETKANNPKQKGKEGGEDVAAATTPSPEKQGGGAANGAGRTGAEACAPANAQQITLEDDYFAHMSEEDSEGEVDRKPFIKREYSSFLTESFDLAFAKHRPFVKQEIKTEIKTERVDDDDDDVTHVNTSNGFPPSSSTSFPIRVKDEPQDSDERTSDEDDDDEDDQESIFPDMDYGSVLDNVVSHRNKLNELRKVIS